MILDDNHSTWEQHSGGDGHYGPEWKSEDLAAAEAFYVSISGKAKVFMDLLIDHPGQLLDVDRICALHPDVFDGSSSIAGSLSGLHQAHEASGRRYPFYWWEGSPTSYSMKPLVANLFYRARS